MSESAYEADRTDVKRLDRAVERCDGGESGEDTGEEPLLAPAGSTPVMVGDGPVSEWGERTVSQRGRPPWSVSYRHQHIIPTTV